MKKSKKLVVLSIISVIIFGVFHSVRAVSSSDFHTESAPKPTGSTYSASANYLEVIWDNAYCMQYGDLLTDSSMTYEVSDIVEIRGNEANFYDSNGTLTNTTSNSRNNKLAGILTPGVFSNDDSWSYGMYVDFSAATADSNGSLENIYSKAQLGFYYIMNGSGSDDNGDGFDDVKWGGYENANGKNPSWSFNSPDENTIGKIAYDEVDVQNGTYGVKFNVDIYRLTSDSYQDILLVYPYDPGDSIPEPDQEVTNITVTKKWDDEDNRDGKRPTEITVTLYADGVASQTATFGGTGNEWTYQFTDLPIKNSDGTTIEYTVKENAIEGYESTQESVYKTE